MNWRRQLKVCWKLKCQDNGSNKKLSVQNSTYRVYLIPESMSGT